MSLRTATWRRRGLIGLMLTLGVSMSACGLQVDTWKEEVLLHDGQTIIVTRSQSYGGRREPTQSPPTKEHRIRFALPGSNRTIEWTSEYGEDVGRANFNLLAVHVKAGTAYVVAEPNLCLSYNKWGRPNPPYVFFRHDGAAWQRIAIELLPVEFKTINVALTLNAVDVEEMIRQRVVPAADVKDRNLRLRQPEYKSILREAIPDAERCPQYSSGPKAPNPINSPTQKQ